MSHHNYYLDLCAESYVVNDDAVLLRFHDKVNIWMGPGGHIDPGEDANETAIREAWEEVGLEITLIGPYSWTKQDTADNKDLVPPMFINRHHITNEHEHSCFIFAATAKSREISPQATQDQAAATKCIWVTKEELDNLRDTDPNLRPEIYRYACAALELAVAHQNN